MAFLRAQGWDIDILAHHRRGGMVLGICGGYQMLGHVIADPLGIEGAPTTVAGLGLLDVTTELTAHKALLNVSGMAFSAAFEGYEMHMGVTAGPDTVRPFALLKGNRTDGAISQDRRVFGTYCHGLLARPALRAELLRRIGAQSEGMDHGMTVDAALDDLANALEQHLDIDGLLALAQDAGR
jgi:adenosylcobyric acid synthase